jgi:porphobilinogen deaminase
LNESSCTLHAEILSPDGSQVFGASLSGAPADAVRIGSDLGHTLLGLAGPDFVAQFRG